MILLQVLFMLVLLPVCSFGPGFFLVRKLGWDPLEKVVASVAVSLCLLYLASFGIYLSGLPWAAAWGVSALCLVLTALSHRELRRLFALKRARELVLWFAFLFAWVLLLLALVRHFTAGCWCCDWYEHWQRTLHFLHHGAKDFLFFKTYPLPARPPMMNLVTALFMAQVGEHFALFQTICAFLNLIVFLPCVLAARLFARRGARHIGLIATFFAACPTYVENASFTWTKAMTCFFIVFSVYLYVVAWRRNDLSRMVAAFASLAVALLVHYSAGPYVLVMALHYLALVWWKRPRRFAELGAIAASSAGILATWLAYSLAVYGPKVTLASNQAAKGAQSLSAKDNLVTAVMNIADTLVPHLLRHPAVPIKFNDSPLRWWGDNLFTVYQVSLIAAMGTVGGLTIVALLAWRLWPRKGSARREQLFWLLLVVLCVCLGITSQGERDYYGLAHITLQSLTLMGITFLVANLPFLPRWLRWAPILGLAIDFTLGIALAVNQEHSLENWAHSGNFDLKKADGFDLKFLGDLLEPGARAIQVLIALVLVALLVRALFWSGTLRLKRRSGAQPG